MTEPGFDAVPEQAMTEPGFDAVPEQAMTEPGLDALQELLLGASRRHSGKRPFLLPARASQAPTSYGQAWEQIGRGGTLFQRAGLRPGDRVLVMTQDPESAALATLSLLVFGMCAVLLDPQLGPGELRDALEQARPRAGLVDRERLGQRDFPDLLLWPVTPKPAAESLLGRLLGRAPQAAPQGYPGLLQELPAAQPTGAMALAEAYIVFTSGSSARARGVRISRGALAAHLGTLARQWGYGAESRIFNGLPLFHADGLIQGPLVAWAQGAAWIRPEPFSLSGAGEWMDLLYRERASHFIAVPTLLSLLLDRLQVPADSFRTGQFELVVSTAAYLDPDLWRRFQERFQVPLANVYGLTETVAGGCFCGPDPASFRIGSVGKPVDCELRIQDDGGRALPPGQGGELCLRGANLLLGYLDGSSGLDAQGWFATGDLAVQDPAGFVTITGRRKNIVIHGGINIQPEEVAAFLATLAGVAEAHVFGSPDPTFGENLVACVVLAPGCPATPASLLSLCRQGLSPAKVPQELHLLAALPRGPSGKVLGPELQRQCALLGPRVPQGNLRDRIWALAADSFAHPEALLRPQSSPANTPGWDSFAHLRFIMALEETFGIQLGTGDILDLHSLGAVEQVLLRLTGSLAGPC